MTTRQPLDARAIALMLSLCLAWSLQQIGLKATAADFSPVLQIGLRSGLAALLVASYLKLRGEPWVRLPGVWKAGLITGLLFGFEYLVVGEALRLTAAAHVIVFLYTAPIFAALGLHWKLPSERLKAAQWMGILLAFAGVAASFAGRDSAAASSVADAAQGRNGLLGDLLALSGGIAWGATTVVIRSTRLSELPAGQTLLYQLTGAFVLLVPAALLMGQTTLHWTWLVAVNFVYQAVVVSFVTFLIWFWLLRYYLASRLGVFSFLTPVFGVLLGAFLLHEHIEMAFVLGSVLVLAGVVLVSAHDWLRQWLGRLVR